MEYLARNKGGGFYEVMRALGVDSPGELYPVFEGLMRDGDIEVAPGFHPNVFLARYQVRVQPRLI